MSEGLPVGLLQLQQAVRAAPRFAAAGIWGERGTKQLADVRCYNKVMLFGCILTLPA